MAIHLVNVGMTESTRQEELTQVRAVMQVDAGSDVIQVEERAAGKRFAPQELVVAAAAVALYASGSLPKRVVLKSNELSIDRAHTRHPSPASGAPFNSSRRG